MSRSATALVVFPIALLVGAEAQADIIRLEATLTRAQEPPPTNTATLVTNPGGLTRPESSGKAIFFLDTTPGAEKLTMMVSVVNIDVGGPGINGGAILPGSGTQTPGDSNDDLVAAHIHVGTGIPGVSTSPVRWGFWGNPFNNTDVDGVMTLVGGVGGEYIGEWDRLEGNGTVSPGVPVTLLNQIPDILNGRAYINFHTEQFPGARFAGFFR